MAIEKYLSRYAETEAQQIECPSRYWRRVLVIPAYRESSTLLDRLDGLLSANPATLVILVINRPDNMLDCGELALVIDQRYPTIARFADGVWYDAGQENSILVIDRYSRGRAIPEKQGVGLARKIGCDIACQLIHERKIACQWIFSSDADVYWPDNYFTVTAPKADAAALLYPFRHVSEAGSENTPIQLYEFSLHYYVAGLRWAGSPYAFHTIGSTFAINYRHYAQVRGFPRRGGGEDFYLLNKLAKTGPIAKLTGPLLSIQDRKSDRVPFGTGPACKSIADLEKPLEQYPLYHPDCFRDLRYCLTVIESLATTDQRLSRFQEIALNAEKEHRPCLAIWQQLGIEKALHHAEQHSGNSEGFLRHFNNWFDGFRTLKLIHTLRDRHYPSLGLRQLLDRDSFLHTLFEEQQAATNTVECLMENLPTMNKTLRAYTCR